MGSSTPKPTAITLDVETLNQIADRLRTRADEITSIVLGELILDLKLAARCADILAHTRFELGEIIAKTTDHDAKLALKNLLDDASVAEPGVGQP